MRVYVDRPVNIWGNDPNIQDQHRLAYSQLTQTLLEANYDFSIIEMRPQAHEHMSDLIRDGIYYAYHAKTPGQNTYCFKHGPLPYLWHMDPGGYSGWCELANSQFLQEQSAHFSTARAETVVSDYRRQMSNENLSILPQADAIPEFEIAGLENFVFCPLQVNNDEVLALGRFPQFEMIRTLVNLSGVRKQHIVFKRHPLCSSEMIEEMLGEVANNPYVQVSNGSVNALISRSLSTVVTNSGVGLQALVHGKPVFSVGKSEYAHMTVQIDVLDGLEQAFNVSDGEQSQRITRQLGYLLDEYLVDVRNREKIAARVATHVETFRSQYQGDDSETEFQVELEQARTFITLSHALQKQTWEQIDILLASYPNLDAERKTEVATALARFARSGHLTRRIVTHTDIAVSGRIIRYYIAKENWAAAEELADMLARLQPADFAQCLLFLSNALFKMKDSRWLRHARAAVTESTTDAATFVFIAQRLMSGASEPCREAREAVAKALSLDTRSSRAWWLQARIALHDGDHVLAKRAITAALAVEPDNKTYVTFAKKIETSD